MPEMTDAREPTQPATPTLPSIERRERHLRMAILLLFFLMAVATIVTYAVVVDPEPAGLGLGRAARPIVLGGLLALTALFCAYVIQAQASFDRVKRLYLRQAQQDPLTGLLARQAFAERFVGEVARAGRTGDPFCVLLCDLDQFALVNEQYGQGVGDAVLKVVAQGVLKATRGSDLAFRWGGDEFLVLLSATSRRGALIASRRIREAVAAASQELQVELDMSVGIAFYPEHATRAKELLALADRALYFAKKSGDKIHVGTEEYEVNSASVEMVFQPVVTLEDREVVGYEALSRDPRGELSIEDLFRRYAAVGQLTELKRFIFKNQVDEARTLELDKVFINIDFATLENVRPFDKPRKVEVVLEISEGESLQDLDAHLATVEAWRALGYKFAIDDFGAGFLSLPFIARLLPDYIKVDREMVVQAGDSEQFGHFLRDLVRAMRNYSRDGIIAEGIETEADMDVVRGWGVDQVQGFLTGAPKPHQP